MKIKVTMSIEKIINIDPEDYGFDPHPEDENSFTNDEGDTVELDDVFESIEKDMAEDPDSLFDARKVPDTEVLIEVELEKL